jgi:Tol biopolymer transport system component
VIDRTGGAGTIVLRGSSFPACSVEWAPDGKRLAAATPHGRLVVVDPSTGATRAIGPLHSLEFAWAPDGSRLLVTGGATAQTCPALWSVRPDGSGLRRLRGC